MTAYGGVTADTAITGYENSDLSTLATSIVGGVMHALAEFAPLIILLAILSGLLVAVMSIMSFVKR